MTTDNVSRYDLHIHTQFSKCSSMDPLTILKVAKSRDLHGLAICDHDTIRGALVTKRIAKKIDRDFLIIPGVEVSTKQGEIICLFIENEVKATSLPEIVDEVKNQDGMIIVPHPFDRFRKKRLRDTEIINQLDAIEVFNSRCLLRKFNNEALHLAAKTGLSVTAGSDAHFYQEIGNAFISIQETGLSEDSLKNTILRGKVGIWGKRSNPMVHPMTLINRKVFRRLKKLR